MINLDPSTHRRKAEAIDYLIDLANRYRYRALTTEDASSRYAANQMANAAMDRAKEVADSER